MLTLGRVLARVADAVGPVALAACSARFSAPVYPGAQLELTWTEQQATRPDVLAARGTVRSGRGRDNVTALVVDVEFGVAPPAPQPDTPPLTDHRLLIERGPATQLACALGARSACWTNLHAARAAGLADLPVVPTLPFVLPAWGWFADQQADGGQGDPPEAVADARRWTGTRGAVVHAGQRFTYHRPLVVGEMLRSRQFRTGEVVRESRRGTLRFTEVTQALTDARGALVATSTAILLPVGDD
jgi:hypothetical protein